MKDLLKELTPELLGLVLDEELEQQNLIQGNDNTIVFADENLVISTINIDTLTRLMKEWCRDSDFYLLSYISQLGGVCEVLTTYNENVFDTCKLHCETEFEAVLKATHWVAKEKGLLK